MSIDPKPKCLEGPKKFEPRQRSTLRGWKKCPSCGELNGQRSLICKNVDCDLRKKMLSNIRPFDPVQLVEYTGVSIFSLRCKDREAQPRSFVQISEVTMSLASAQAAIVSKNASCFVDSCQYEADSTKYVTCKHIKACAVEPGKPAFPKADVYTITREVLFNLNISAEQKQNIWSLYKEDECTVPAVQRINASTFAVKCVQSNVFPAGRLHVVAMNTYGSGKKNNHACTCKKMKIIVEPDNSVVMQDEVCEHLLMLLSAILSHPNGKASYGNFVNSLKTYWMPQTLNTPVMDMTNNESLLVNGSKMEDQQNADDGIFIFDENFMTNELLSDLSDIIMGISGEDDPMISRAGSASPSTNCFGSDNNKNPLDLLHLGDPNLMSSSDLNEDSGMDLQSISTLIESIQQSSPEELPQLELSDCKIELMDQFQLTDHLDICSEDLILPLTTDLGGDDSLNIFAPQLQEIANDISRTNSLLTPNIVPVVEAPPIELPTIEVVKKGPVKVSEIVDEVKSRKFPPLPPKRALIVNDIEPNEDNVETITGLTEPALSYTAWLEYVIECINESVSVNEQNNVHHNFHVHEEIFAHFSKSFSVGNKLRMPNSTTTVKHGSRKGLTKYTWYFTTASTVRRIFQTKNISIELERNFELSNEGSFVPYIPKPIDTSIPKGRRIYPKLTLYAALINFAAGDSNHKTGLKVEWIPKVFPKSNYGSLTVEFSLSVRDPQSIFSNIKTVSS